MDQLRDYADERQRGFCVHCAGRVETADHAPSKVFLDKPYPENLPVHESCARCNEGFSLDEEYLACLIECVATGTTSPELVSRENIRDILRRSPALASRIEKGKQTSIVDGKETFVWSAETERVQRVICKLARCHAAHELAEPQHGPPAVCSFFPLLTLTEAQRRHFETPPTLTVFPEVGSRALQRIAFLPDKTMRSNWIVAQEGRYRYLAVYDGSILVRGVIGEYLGFEVIWND